MNLPVCSWDAQPAQYLSNIQFAFHTTSFSHLPQFFRCFSSIRSSSSNTTVRQSKHLKGRFQVTLFRIENRFAPAWPLGVADQTCIGGDGSNGPGSHSNSENLHFRFSQSCSRQIIDEEILLLHVICECKQRVPIVTLN